MPLGRSALAIAALAATALAPILSNAQTIADDMQALMERFENQCTRVFLSGPEIFVTLAEEMPGSFAISSDDQTTSYFVWLTEDYTMGMTVVTATDDVSVRIHCDVNYGNYSNFDPAKAEDGLRKARLPDRTISITGGPMQLVAGSRDRLEQLYTSKPLRFLTFAGIFENPTILSGAEINHTGSVNLTANSILPMAENN